MSPSGKRQRVMWSHLSLHPGLSWPAILPLLCLWGSWGIRVWVLFSEVSYCLERQVESFSYIKDSTALSERSKTSQRPSQCGSVGWASSRKWKSHSHRGRDLGCGFGLQTECMQEATDRSHRCFSPSFPLSLKINTFLALAGVAQWIEHWPVNQRVTGSIPSLGTHLGFRPGPQWRVQERQPHIDVSLLLFLPPSPSLKMNK